jgi:hypothetical protein
MNGRYEKEENNGIGLGVYHTWLIVVLAGWQAGIPGEEEGGIYQSTHTHTHV